MREQTNTREAFIEVPGGRVWSQVVGGGERVPLVVLHGGPGFPHDYVRSLEELADERPVVFYDQLGCGRSDRPDDLGLWTVERAVEELATVLAALGLSRIHLLGQSWGSMLAVEYALSQPGGMVSLVLASPCISIPRWVEDADRFRSALPPEVQDVIQRHEQDGFTSCPEYQAAMLAFYRRHVCRMDPWPMEFERAFAGHGAAVYETMWGPSEFSVTGRLRSFDRSARLCEITVPSLFTCGRFDEATPETVAWYQGLLPGAELAVFEASAHLAHLEERDRYNAVVRGFLGRAERR
jgi:proline iminopeptidase